MTDFENVKFANEAVSLDGNKYEGCTFTNCELLIGASAPFGLSNSNFTGCDWTFTGSAGLTMHILALLYQSGPEIQKVIEQTFEAIRGRGNEGITLH